MPTPLQTRVEMTQIVLPTHTNNHGTVFGGQIMAWCDIAAAVAAQRFCGAPVVTASMDRLDFLHPVNRADIVVLTAIVNQAWGSSLEVGVRVVAESPVDHGVKHCCSAYLTFVALDGDKRPRRVPPLRPETDEERERAAAADLRRAQRRADR